MARQTTTQVDATESVSYLAALFRSAETFASIDRCNLFGDLRRAQLERVRAAGFTPCRRRAAGIGARSGDAACGRSAGAGRRSGGLKARADGRATRASARRL